MQPQNSQQALAELQAKQTTAQNPNQILEAQRQGLGVQGATDTVTGLRAAINNTTKLLKQVAPSVMGRTGSSLVTNAQATRQIGNEQAPISQNLAEQGTEYNEANRNLSELDAKAQQAASGIYQGEQDKLGYMQNLYNTLYTREQDAERARIAEMERQEAIRQFNASRSSGGSNFDLGGDTPVSTANTVGQANNVAGLASIEKDAYNDVAKRKGQTREQIMSDYNATAKSAARGNQKDILKIQIYNKMMPELLSNYGTSNKLRNTVVQQGQAITNRGYNNPLSAGANLVRKLF